MQQLINKIEQWAEDRNLINGCTPLDQAMKLFSEFGELADAVAKDDLEGIKDGIGDVFVVMTIMCKQVKHNDIASTMLADVSGISLKRHVVELGLALNQLAYNGDCNKSIHEDLSVALSCLVEIAKHNKLTIEQCVEHAYNEIKDRKGIMHNGTFIKESDPRYAELVSA